MSKNGFIPNENASIKTTKNRPARRATWAADLDPARMKNGDPSEAGRRGGACDGEMSAAVRGAFKRARRRLNYLGRGKTRGKHQKALGGPILGLAVDHRWRLFLALAAKHPPYCKTFL